MISIFAGCLANHVRAHRHIDETGLLPWDIEMTVEESVSDDDDAPPHRVSDCESESESEEDSD